MPPERLTVLVPCLNEEQTVEATVSDILRVAGDLPLEVSILLIDDGSSDGTRARMQELCRRYGSCDMICHEQNLGLGRVVMNAYDKVQPGSWVTVMPGDNEVVFDSIRNHLRIRDDYHVILGYLQNPVIRTLTRRLASWVFSRIVNVLYGFPYRYLNGLKLYRLEAFRGIDVLSSGHAYNAELLAKAQLRDPMLRVGEAPFASRGRAKGISSAFRPGSVWRALRDLIRGYRAVTAYREQGIRDSLGQQQVGAGSSATGR